MRIAWAFQLNAGLLNNMLDGLLAIWWLESESKASSRAGADW
jgi:hypothetical protein